MNDSAKIISTWELLADLGFQPGENDERVYDFGDFKLFAGPPGFDHRRSCIEVVPFHGGWLTTRKMAWVEFELPVDVESQEQCAAFLAYFLDRYDGECFNPKVTTFWLDLGRQYKHLLPWERETAAYDARPHCIVERDWMRVATKSLQKIIEAAPADSVVVFAFDGVILSIMCNRELVAMPAKGERWLSKFAIPVEKIKHLPKRFLSDRVNVSIWEMCLQFGNHRYPGASEFIETDTDTLADVRSTASDMP
jgi:hypothetical protein